MPGVLISGWCFLINDMSKELNVDKITLSATYYNNIEAPASHNVGLGIDITDMSFNDGKDSVIFKYSDNKIDESSSAALVFAWLINRSEVMDVYNPWQMFRQSANILKPFPNLWTYDDPTISDYQRMIDHNNHMHLRLMSAPI